MVRISVFVGILIELWKVPKILNFEVCSFLCFRIYVFLISVYQNKHGLVLYQNISIFINNPIKIQRHLNMIELVNDEY
jgi:hypothetical protein